jgi:hypothetical protein
VIEFWKRLPVGIRIGEYDILAIGLSLSVDPSSFACEGRTFQPSHSLSSGRQGVFFDHVPT